MGLFDGIRDRLDGGTDGDEAPSDERDEAPSDDHAGGPAATSAGGPSAAAPAGTDPTPDADEDPRERFREEAAELVEFWAEHDLDYTPESLSRLDDFVDEKWDADRFRDAEFGAQDDADSLTFTGLVVQLGSYFGETLVRTYDAEWRHAEDFGWVVAVAGEEGGNGEGGERGGEGEDGEDREEVLANVFHVAQDCLREPSKFAASHDNVVAHLGVGEPVSDGDHVNIVVEVPDEDADPADLRADAEALVDDFSWYDLDYSPDSLDELDDLVRTELFDGETLVDEFQGTELSVVVRRLGAYFGEVLVRHHDGEWTYAEDTWGVAVPTEGGTVQAEVFQAGLEALHEGVDFRTLYRAFEDTAAGGAAGGGEAAADEGVGADLRERAADFVADHPDRDLDYSPDSLARLDDLAAAEYGDASPEDYEGEDEGMVLALEALPYGAYFGEVVGRNNEADWVDTEEGFTVAVATPDGEAVGVDVVDVAITCLVHDRSFEAAYERLLSAGT